MRPAILGACVATLLTGGLVWLGATLGPGPQPRWKVVHRTAAHRMLVLDIETAHPDEAMSIAQVLGDREHPRFTEILMFFHPPGRRDALRRVQWTRERGYVEWIYH